MAVLLGGEKYWKEIHQNVNAVVTATRNDLSPMVSKFSIMFLGGGYKPQA